MEKIISEIKNEISNLYELSKKLTEKKEITYVNEPKSINGLKYIIEFDRMDNPQKYYHYQDGIYTSEIRKGRKTYNIITYGYEIHEKELEKNQVKKIKKWGNNIHYIYECETLEEATQLFLKSVKSELEMKIRIRDNLLNL